MTIDPRDVIARPPMLRMQAFGIVAALAAMGVILLLPTPEGLTIPGQRLAAVFVGALVLWGTEALPIAVTALLAIVLQPVLGIRAIVPAIEDSMSPIFFFVFVMGAAAVGPVPGTLEWIGVFQPATGKRAAVSVSRSMPGGAR